MKKPLDPADLNVTSFDTVPSTTAHLLYQPQLPTTDPTAETRCFYCPIDYTFDCI
ncbi:MAG TPA: hypothetical protein VFJ82_24455 [Longimicrobium sp.]|nr:hypothetical protein [Longimicrobium sp.]